MRCGFRPHDRDRTTYSMEESLVGFGLVREGVLLHTQMDIAVTRLTVGVPNDLQMERNLTGGLPVVYQGHLTSLGPFRERLTPAHERKQEGYTPEEMGAPDCKTDNGENARMHETNTYANAMHVMT